MTVGLYEIQGIVVGALLYMPVTDRFGLGKVSSLDLFILQY